jgi:hypothetical protein
MNRGDNVFQPLRVRTGSSESIEQRKKATNHDEEACLPNGVRGVQLHESPTHECGLDQRRRQNQQPRLRTLIEIADDHPCEREED